MSSTNLIPVFTPEGNLAKIPAENIAEAMKPENGFKMAVSLTSPEGNAAWVPNDKAHDALAQGFKLGPPEQNPTNTAGGPDINSIGRTLKEGGKDLLGAAGGMADMFSGSQVTAPLKLGAGMAQGHIQAYQDAKDAAQHGNVPKAMFKSVAAGIPIVGPMASDIYDDAEAGNNERAVGKGLSRILQVAAPEFAPKALPALADATEGLRNTVADTLSESAQSSLGKVLAPTKQATKFIAKEKVIPGMQERGITAASSKSLQGRAASNVEDLGQKIDDAYDAQPVQPSIPTQPIIDKLEAYKKNFTNEVPSLGNQPAKTVVLDPAAIDRISQVQDLIAQHGEALDPQSLRTLRQHFDENVAAGKGYAGKTMAEGHSLEVQKQAANAIRGQLAESVPGLADLNSEFSFWKNLHDVMEQTAQRRTGQQGGGLGRKIAIGTGTAVGAHIGGAPGALIGAETGNFLSRLTNSTAWNTVSAKLKTGLANALATKDPAAINQAVTAIKQQPQIKGLLGQGATITPPPADTSGSVPFSAPPVAATSRAQRMGLLLPEKANPESIPLQTSTAPTSQEGLLPAARRTVRDPKTGQMKVQFLTSPAEQSTRPAFLRSQQADAATVEPPAPRSLADIISGPKEDRTNLDYRAAVDKMKPEEQVDAIFRNKLSSLPNGRAYDLAKSQLADTHPHIGFADIDDFKNANTQLGEHGVDSAIFPAVGDAIRAAVEKENGGVHAFHVHGDEFNLLGSEPQAISRVIDNVNAQMKDAVFQVQKPDGTIGQVNGVGFSHGTGPDEASAAAAEQLNKQARKEAGLRIGSRDKTQDQNPRTGADTSRQQDPQRDSRRQDVSQSRNSADSANQQNPVNRPSLADILKSRRSSAPSTPRSLSDILSGKPQNTPSGETAAPRPILSQRDIDNLYGRRVIINGDREGELVGFPNGKLKVRLPNGELITADWAEATVGSQPLSSLLSGKKPSKKGGK